MPPSPAPYLCCYNYGQGGVWLLVDAASPEEVTNRYPGLTVFIGRPDWMTPEEEERMRQELEATGFRWNVRMPPTGWLLSYAQNEAQ
jgi:hypothetical protein